MADFRKLEVWSRSHALVLQIYEQSRRFPQEERFGLQSQLRRAAVSIPTNVAEGSGRRTPRDFAHFLSIAAGSTSEVHYLLMLCSDLGYLPADAATALIDETQQIRRMLYAYRSKLI